MTYIFNKLYDMIPQLTSSMMRFFILKYYMMCIVLPYLISNVKLLLNNLCSLVSLFFITFLLSFINII